MGGVVALNERHTGGLTLKIFLQSVTVRGRGFIGS